MVLQFGGGDVGVFDNVVEKAGGNHGAVTAQVAQQPGDGNGVADVGLPRGPVLALVQGVGKLKGLAHQQVVRFILWVVGLVIDTALMVG